MGQDKVKRDVQEQEASSWVLEDVNSKPLQLVAEVKPRKKLHVHKEAKVSNTDEEKLVVHDAKVVGKTFKELGVPEWLIDLAASLRITTPTKIQELCLPAALKGDNVIGCAQTGTGKTICFCWPILIALSKDPYGVFGLVLTGSRELAFQIGDQFNIFGVQMNIKICVCVGGVDIVQQSLELEARPHVVIATPGRLAEQVDVKERNIAKVFAKVKYLVFDEADILLHQSFEAPLQKVISCLPSTKEGRITYLFSATITKAIRALCDSFKGVQFHFFDVTKGQEASFRDLELKQHYLFLPQHVHLPYLVHILQTQLLENETDQGIIFTATKRRCQLVAVALDLLDFKATCIHSLMKQRKRNACLAKFRTGVSKILVATDLVARGIDIQAVSFVVNLDFPGTTEDYIHRVGRTARSGKSGVAISFIDEDDVEKLKKVEEDAKVTLTKLEVDDSQAVKLLNKVSIATQRARVYLQENNYLQDK
ncbi:DEAD/DEAH box helicase family protein, putative [Babesia bigemina]|uniref:DEAD/DEAH box helicase family protein, putative n=1 Tax=Babesia bigemina TaxID=5866 RepID=A0A061DE74_BABBI|nr:DEAD/DEAH box helicase family protein, putative [Babesia bigemina]CDR96890.1 DEAD/DEAH box helicase family protein, putative [Babesia bigemina]|eukprot:XP_012769076.1 DEAD/DEAH box helicase family protein, putative [Babesia bigemina]